MASIFGSKDSFVGEDSPKSGGRAPASRSNFQAFLGQGCSYEGKLTFEGEVRIAGKFKGEIFSNDSLIIEKGAQVEGQIDVATLAVSGNVSGTINARKQVDLHAPAKVTGSITTPIIVIAEGVVFDGNLSMSDAGKKAAKPNRPAAPANGKPSGKSTEMDMPV